MSSLLDRLSELRDRADARPRRWLILVAALWVAGGLARLALDHRPVEWALPEPQPLGATQWAQQDSNL